MSIPSVTTGERAAIYRDMVRVLGELHSVDWRAVGLDGFGREGNYYRRQLKTWGDGWQQSKVEPVPSMDELTTIVDMTRPDSPIDDTLFPGTPKTYVWSATANERTPTQAWAMFNANGYLMSAWQSLAYSLRLVRSKS